MKILGYFPRRKVKMAGDIFVYKQGDESFNLVLANINGAAQEAGLPPFPNQTVVIIEDDYGNRKALWRKDHSIVEGTKILFTESSNQPVNVNKQVNINGILSGEWPVTFLKKK